MGKYLHNAWSQLGAVQGRVFSTRDSADLYLWITLPLCHSANFLSREPTSSHSTHSLQWRVNIKHMPGSWLKTGQVHRFLWLKQKPEICWKATWGWLESYSVLATSEKETDYFKVDLPSCPQFCVTELVLWEHPFEQKHLECLTLLSDKNLWSPDKSTTQFSNFQKPISTEIHLSKAGTIPGT